MSTTIDFAPAKDLTEQPPRSPRKRLRDYAILGRTLDKCRADLEGRIGEYHYGCPLDQAFLGFKGLNAEEFKNRVDEGGTDMEIAEWLDKNGIPKAPEEIIEWSNSMDVYSPFEDPEKRDWFAEECERLGLDPEKATLFEMLEKDDLASFGKL